MNKFFFLKFYNYRTETKKKNESLILNQACKATTLVKSINSIFPI